MSNDSEINNSIRVLKARGLKEANIAASLGLDIKEVRERLRASIDNENMDVKQMVVQAQDQYDVLFAELGSSRLTLENEIDKKVEDGENVDKQRTTLLKMIDMQTGLLDKKVKLMTDLGQQVALDESISALSVSNPVEGSITTTRAVQPRWDLEALAKAAQKYEDTKHWKLWGCINVLYEMGFKDRMDKVTKTHRSVVIQAFKIAGKDVNDGQVSYAVTCSRKYGEKLPDEQADDGMPSYDEMMKNKKEMRDENNGKIED
jgi:hypothetical protein